MILSCALCWLFGFTFRAGGTGHHLTDFSTCDIPDVVTVMAVAAAASTTIITIGIRPSHRFCTPAEQCPIIDPDWQSSEGVPIDAILFGGRRPAGVPLVYEAFDWKHGVFVGASMKSEATAAAEHKGKIVMHDPFAMRPFFGYNFGHYLQHWLSMETAAPNVRLPRVYHVNWFRKDERVGFSAQRPTGARSRVRM